MTNKLIAKHYATNIKSGKEITQRKPEIISVSPTIDVTLGGGVPAPSWITLSGAPKCGKTTLALQIMANAMEAGMKAYYLNIEHRLKSMNLRGIHNLNPKDVNVVESTKEKILTAEDFLTIGREVLRDEDRVVMILDSVSSLCSESEFSSETITGAFRSPTGRIMASFCKQNAAAIGINNSIVIMIHHIISNTSGYGKTRIEDGGVKAQYQSDVKLLCKKITPDPWVEDGVQIGQIVPWTCEWGALDNCQKGEVLNYLRYGYGIDREIELVEIASMFGIIEKTSKGSSWLTYGDLKIQGKNKFARALKEDKKLFKKIQDSVKKVLS